MKHFISRLAAFFLIFSLLLSTIVIAASGADYSDISGHWAEQTLEQAVNDGLLEGSGGKLSPDDPITGAEMVSILTRIFSAENAANISNISGISSNDWYYDAASKAVAMGIITPENGRLDLNEPVNRVDAFSCVVEAFQLESTAEDTSVLNNYSDGAFLTGAHRTATAALISGGYIEGYGGALHISDDMTRAEFVTVVYKIALIYGTGGRISVVDGGMVVSDDDTLDNTVYSGSLYFDCPSSNIILSQVTAPCIVLRSENLNSLTLNGCDIDRLVFAANSGDMHFMPNASNAIHTVVVGSGSGKLLISGQITDIEITGDNREIIVNSSVTNLTISGSNNRLLINPGVSVANLTTLTEASGNTVTVNGHCTQCALFGSNTDISGYGTVSTVSDNATGSSISVATTDITVNENFGLNGVTLNLSAPDTVTSYENLAASVVIDTPDTDIKCTGRWYLNDTLITMKELSLSEQTADSLDLDVADYRGELPVTVKLTYVLSYSLPNNIYQELSTEKNLTLESRTKYSAQEVLSLVTTGYQGNYTLAWAEANDYDSVLKEEWINVKGYTSKTDYLIWVSITYQRVNIFTGSDGQWELEKTFIVGTGAPGHSTPTGVFSVLAKRPVGWTTSSYTVEPLINFYSSAYAFHSRLYYPGTTTILDARIGFPISHGCVRMYDEDIAYMFDTIPVGTTVVIY